MPMQTIAVDRSMRQRSIRVNIGTLELRFVNPASIDPKGRIHAAVGMALKAQVSTTLEGKPLQPV